MAEQFPPKAGATSSRIAIARLLRPQGRRGELLAEPLSNLPGLFEVGRHYGCTIATGTPAAPSNPTGYTLESFWTPTGRNAGRLVLKLAGVDSISEAEALAGRELLLYQAELPLQDPDTFLVGDLIGCTLFDAGLPVGEIMGVDFPTGPDGRTRLEEAAPFLLIESATASDEEPVLVPFVKAWLQEVDLGSRSVRMILPEGLFADLGGSGDEEPALGGPEHDETE